MRHFFTLIPTLLLGLTLSAQAQIRAAVSTLQSTPLHPQAADAIRSLPSGFAAPDLTEPENKTVQATYTVTTDATDGPGSLREAILAANASPGLDAIEFNINGGGSYEEIFLTRSLPVIFDPVYIDGDTQGCDTTLGLCIRIDGEDVVLDPIEFDGGLGIAADGTTIHGLVITRFHFPEDTQPGFYSGIYVASSNTVVTGCRIGTDRTGSTSDPDGMPDTGDELGNGFGLYVGDDSCCTGAVGNRIGGTTEAERNIISGNVSHGINMRDETTGLTLIVGNYIGTDVTGTFSLGSQVSGVLVSGATYQNTIEGNLISGNSEVGIQLQGLAEDDPPGPVDNVIRGNRVGTNASGTAPLPNGTLAGLAEPAGFGISIHSGSNTLVENNLASGNLFAGILLGTLSEGRTVADNVIRANLIGTDASGTQPLSNGVPSVPDVGFGIAMAALPSTIVTGNVIGGDSFADANIIGFNTTAGIGGDGPGVIGNVIDHNYIGVSPTFEPIPNGLAGVIFRNYASGNRVGSLAPTGEFSGNVIAYQQVGVGLGLLSNEVAFNTFGGQPNAFLPVDLGLDGPTFNDAGDPDEGPNRLQNAPDVTSAFLTSDQITVSYRVDTEAANATYPLTVRFFAKGDDGSTQAFYSIGNATYDASDAGSVVTTTIPLPAPVPPGTMPQIVAMATDAAGNTSEASLFGPTVTPLAGCGYTFEATSVGGTAVASAGGQVRFAFALDNTSGASTATASVWATIRNASGEIVFARSARNRMPSVPAGETLVAGYNQRVPASVPDGDYTYTLMVGEYAENDPSTSVVCGSRSFEITKGDASKVSGATVPLVSSDWSDAETVDVQVSNAALLAASGEAVRVVPNPMREAATFAFSLATPTEVTLAVYDARGREIVTVAEGRYEAGDHTVPLRQRLPTGVYMWRLTAGDRMETGRLTVAR